MFILKAVYFYEVIPASSKFLGTTPLVYCCDKSLKNGQIVEVRFRRFSCLGFVAKPIKKPQFPTQEISDVYVGFVLPSSSRRLFEWLQDYYPGPIGPSAQLFLPSSLSQKKLSDTQNKAQNTHHKKLELPPLTAEQNKAIKKINSLPSRTFLLHGVTGSGKTRIYLELAKKCLEQNKSVIVLTPEISLTPQLVNIFAGKFGDKVLLTHSGLTNIKRSRVWQTCLRGKGPWIVMGPRSALFSPIANLGLVIVDETHDSSYKQDSLPFYNALRVAGFLSAATDSKLIMGSATPSVNEYFLAGAKNIPIINLKEKAIKKTTKSEIKGVNITDKKEKSRFPLISNTLIKDISMALENKTQSLVFINKRGDSKSIVCQSCGWRAKCERCDLPLTYHLDDNKFSCHTCGKDYSASTSCPMCGSTEIMFKSPGTKAIAKSLAKLFPSAMIARFDTDNKKAERIDSRHQDLVSGNIDILVGTQIITKGHDLPRLSLAAMLTAESDLNFPDFTAEEKSFQTIQQLSGRVGRGHIPGKVIIQSFDPKNPLIKQSIAGDYLDFYKNQLKEREEFGFPPFYHVLKILLPRATSGSSLRSAETLASEIKNICPNCSILGPSMAFHFKKSGKYSWQLIVKSKNRTNLTKIVKNLHRKSNCIVNIDPLNLL